MRSIEREIKEYNANDERERERKIPPGTKLSLAADFDRRCVYFVLDCNGLVGVIGSNSILANNKNVNACRFIAIGGFACQGTRVTVLKRRVHTQRRLLSLYSNIEVELSYIRLLFFQEIAVSQSAIDCNFLNKRI